MIANSLNPLGILLLQLILFKLILFVPAILMLNSHTIRPVLPARMRMRVAVMLPRRGRLVISWPIYVAGMRWVPGRVWARLGWAIRQWWMPEIASWSGWTAERRGLQLRE